MRKKRCIWILLTVVASICAWAAVPRPYETAKIVDVEQKSRERVLYYLVNTPVTQDDPYFEITLQLKDTLYIGEYVPRHAADTLPAEWIENAPVQVRMEKHYMFLKRPSGDELQFTITKQKAAPPAPKASDPAARP